MVNRYFVLNVCTVHSVLDSLFSHQTQLGVPYLHKYMVTTHGLASKKSYKEKSKAETETKKRKHVITTILHMYLRHTIQFQPNVAMHALLLMQFRHSCCAHNKNMH